MSEASRSYGGIVEGVEPDVLASLTIESDEDDCAAHGGTFFEASRRFDGTDSLWGFRPFVRLRQFWPAGTINHRAVVRPVKSRPG